MIEILERSIFCLMMDDGSIYSNLTFARTSNNIFFFILFYTNCKWNYNCNDKNAYTLEKFINHIFVYYLKNILFIYTFDIFYIYHIILYYILYFIIYFWVFKDTDLIDISNKKNYFTYKFISYSSLHDMKNIL